MAQLNITDAAFAGFGVIKRNPLAPAIWGLIQLALFAGPLALLLPAVMDLVGMVIAAERAGTEPDLADVMAIQGQMNLMSPLAGIAGLMARGLIGGAIFRAVLSPQDNSWFFMRVGMGELMLVVTGIVLTVIAVVAFLISALILALFAVLVGQAAEIAGIIVGVLGGLALMAVSVWAVLRLSMSFGLSFDRKAFLLFESWPMTRNRVGGLFLMAVVSSIVVGLLQWFVFGLIFGVLAAGLFGTGVLTPESLQDPAQLLTPELLSGLLPWGLGGILFGSIAAGYLSVLTTAPWAAAYQALRPVADPPATEPNRSALVA